jgi:hypothetical protein
VIDDKEVRLRIAGKSAELTNPPSFQIKSSLLPMARSTEKLNVMHRGLLEVEEHTIRKAQGVMPTTVTFE